MWFLAGSPESRANARAEIEGAERAYVSSATIMGERTRGRWAADPASRPVRSDADRAGVVEGLTIVTRDAAISRSLVAA